MFQGAEQANAPVNPGRNLGGLLVIIALGGSDSHAIKAARSESCCYYNYPIISDIETIAQFAQLSTPGPRRQVRQRSVSGRPSLLRRISLT